MTPNVTADDKDSTPITPERQPQAIIIEKILESFSTSEEFVRFWGFPFEPHYAKTKDGYILALHRIPTTRKEHEDAMNAEFNGLSRKLSRRLSLLNRQKRGGRLNTPKQTRPVVLLWHGFLMSSEVFVCQPMLEKNLAFVLADAGYDVWLGNTRGNKYSSKHVHLKPSKEDFWDFSLDNLALYDLPNTVDYILNCTGAPSLTYIGFSQGSAQGFSALSLNSKLNKKINLFIALAPVSKPKGKGIDNKLIDSLVSSSPEVIYLLFGRKVMLSSVLFWQLMFSSWKFASILDNFMWMLFGWTSEYFDHKNLAYKQMYSFTSVKVVVHWFQIMRMQRFQMYEESPTLFRNAIGGHVVPRFPTEHIKTPIALFYGANDTLPDINYILRHSPTPVFCLKIDEYEHTNFLWGKGIGQIVFPGILGLLHEYAEIWPETGENHPITELEKANSEVHLQASTETETDVFRTVPWISKSQIDTILAYGVGTKVDLDDGIGVSFESCSISVNKFLNIKTKTPRAIAKAKIRETRSGWVKEWLMNLVLKNVNDEEDEVLFDSQMEIAGDGMNLESDFSDFTAAPVERLTITELLKNSTVPFGNSQVSFTEVTHRKFGENIVEDIDIQHSSSESEDR
ncbi:cholesterol esterase [Nowakowskiella sp. JEL0407]|nr:cholesterol esterase [Nowakowskiella sp. JEL0407]